MPVPGSAVSSQGFNPVRCSRSLSLRRSGLSFSSFTRLLVHGFVLDRGGTFSWKTRTRPLYAVFDKILSAMRRPFPGVIALGSVDGRGLNGGSATTSWVDVVVVLRVTVVVPGFASVCVPLENVSVGA